MGQIHTGAYISLIAPGKQTIALATQERQLRIDYIACSAYISLDISTSDSTQLEKNEMKKRNKRERKGKRRKERKKERKKKECTFYFFLRTLLLCSSFGTSLGHRCLPFFPPALCFNLHRA